MKEVNSWNEFYLGMTARVSYTPINSSSYVKYLNNDLDEWTLTWNLDLETIAITCLNYLFKPEDLVVCGLRPKNAIQIASPAAQGIFSLLPFLSSILLSVRWWRIPLVVLGNFLTFVTTSLQAGEEGIQKMMRRWLSSRF